MKQILIVLMSFFSSLTAFASHLVVAKIAKRSEGSIPQKTVVLLNQLEREGKVILRDNENDTEIAYFEKDSPHLLEALDRAGIVARKISTESQKTGGSCGGVTGALSSQR